MMSKSSYDLPDNKVDKVMRLLKVKTKQEALTILNVYLMNVLSGYLICILLN